MTQLLTNQAGRVFCRVENDGTQLFHCNICGEFKSLESFGRYKSRFAIRNSLRVQPACKRCVNEKATKWQQDNPEKRKRVEERHRGSCKGRATRLLINARRHSRDMNLPCTITKNWILERLVRGVCEETGIRFEMDSQPLRKTWDSPRWPWALFASCARVGEFMAMNEYANAKEAAKFLGVSLGRVHQYLTGNTISKAAMESGQPESNQFNIFQGVLAMTEAEMNASMSAAQPVIEAESAAVGIVIPWMLIIQIFSQLLIGCLTPPKPAELKSAAAEPGLWTVLRARSIARRHLGWSASHAEVVSTVNVGFAAIAKMDDVHVQRLAASVMHLGNA